MECSPAAAAARGNLHAANVTFDHVCERLDDVGFCIVEGAVCSDSRCLCVMLMFVIARERPSLLLEMQYESNCELVATSTLGCTYRSHQYT